MAKKSAETPFSKFFNEESQDIFKKSDLEGEELTFKDKINYPVLPETKPAEELKMKQEWRLLRKFFSSSKGGNLTEKLIPIHLHPSLLSINSRSNYPALVLDNSSDANGTLQSGCISLYDFLSDHINDSFPDKGQGELIKKILPRIVGETRDFIEVNGISKFSQVLDKTLELLKVKMGLRGSDEELFDSQISELKSKIKVDGILVPYSTDVALKLLEVALTQISVEGKMAIGKRINKILPPLSDILDIEIENNPESMDAEHLKSSIGFADHYLDFEKLSSVLPESSSEHISKERFERIKKIIEVLKNYGSTSRKNAIVLVENELFDSESVKNVFSDSELVETPLKEVFSSSLTIFKTQVSEYTEIVKALRIGELEIKNKYVEEIHEEFFNSFDWTSFTSEEMSYFPPIVLIADACNIANTQLAGFSALLHTSAPINVIAIQKVWTQDEGDLTDLSSLAISHRNIYVFQSTPLNPKSLFNGFKESFSSRSPSFCQIEISVSENKREALLELSTSVDSRFFPQFSYNGVPGTAWGSRFGINDNTQVDKDWTEYEYQIIDSEGNTSSLNSTLTCADFLTLKKGSTEDFKIVEPEYWNNDLIHISEYLRLEEVDLYSKIPYVWMIDEENRLLRVALSWKIVMTVAEKLEYWHYLQDVGGINNFHVQKALKLQEEKIRKEADEKIEKLKEEHLAMLEQVRKESAEEAMDHLTSALLDLDTDAVINPVKKASLPQSDTPGVITDPEPQKSTEAKAEVTESEKEEEVISEEPWIETPLCTNCNECTDINNRMFNYNANKLAFIADPEAGTFAQLVEAAEKCPVSIIHPGKPLNPKEPDLEDLMARAKKFN